jgi:hypothetical protein
MMTRHTEVQETNGIATHLRLAEEVLQHGVVRAIYGLRGEQSPANE